MGGRFFKFIAIACIVLASCEQKKETKLTINQTDFRSYKTFELSSHHAYMPYSFADEKDSRYAFDKSDMVNNSKHTEVENFINISDSIVVIGDASNKATRRFKIVESFLDKQAGTVDSCYRLVDANGVECLFCHSIDLKNKTYFNFRFGKTSESYQGLKLD